MTHDDFDIDLERRLRSIGRTAPEAPASLDDAAREVALRGRTRKAPGLGGRVRSTPLRWLGAVAATLAVLVLTASVLGIGPTYQDAAGWTPRADAGQGEWTAIEWHDISASFNGHFGGGWAGQEMVRWAHGFALSDLGTRWWLSDDGFAWHLATGIPAGSLVVGAGERLLVINMDSGQAWTTVDGERLTPCTPPFDIKHIWYAASNKPGVLVLTGPDQDPTSPKPYGPSQFNFSRDGLTWTTAVLPADLAEARGVHVQPFSDGFLAIGDIEDPDGFNSSGIAGPGGQPLDWRYSQAAWFSADGITWSKSPATSPDPGLQWETIQVGRLGMSLYTFHSTDGGQTWINDAVLPAGDAPAQSASDGTRIIYSTDGGGRFYLSEGDGRWRLLAQGGDVGHLPNDGAMVLEPKGILWISGSRVYYGEALAGIQPQGSIGVPVSPSPDPYAVPIATPVPASSPTPPPPTRP
jgi:hypothetical protein